MEKNNPTVLLGIVTRNRADILPKAIASAFSQRGCEVRVAVVNDGSTDDTAKIASQFPAVQWVNRSPGRGYMAARNDWMESATEDFFVSLDDDAWFLQGDEISVALEAMARNPRVGAVAFDILSPDRPAPKPRAPHRPTANFIGCGHVLRLAAVREIGCYADTPGNYGGEEKDLCLRLMDAGYEVVLLPGVHVWHDKTPVARQLPAQYRSLVCNDLVFTLRRTPAWLLPMALAGKICQHWTFALKRKLMRPCGQGFGMFARAFGGVWRSRRPVRYATLRAFMRLARS